MNTEDGVRGDDDGGALVYMPVLPHWRHERSSIQ
jgi:hypothetical protein